MRGRVVGYGPAANLVVAGLLTSTRYNALPNLTLNGGTLDQSATDSGGYEGYQFLGTVTVGGYVAEHDLDRQRQGQSPAGRDGRPSSSSPT